MEDKLFKEGTDIDPEDLIQPIDIDAIDDEAMRLAMEMVDNLASVYFDKEFMEENPNLKKRIDFSIDGLRLLLKMRKTSEKTHDICVNAITTNPNNASMYLSQARIEGNLLSIQKQIDDTVASLCNLLKGYQLELNFNQQQSVDEDTGEIVDTSQSVHRGSKSFIQQMKEKNISVSPQTEIEFNETQN
jgi:hypothetical protein